MPALSGPQLAALRSSPQNSNWYCVPVAPVTVFAAQINSGSITVGAVTIPYDNVTLGAFGDVLKGATVLVGSAPGLSDYGVLRERLNADASNLYVAWNSDIAWQDDLYLTVYAQYLAWSVRQRIVPPAIYKDYNIAYTDQTSEWPPVALMGDNVCKFFTANPTPVYFDGSGSYAVDAGATIASYAWAFGDGGTSTAATPGNHNYTAAGTYYATLTVTDSNGKTHLTRRIISLPAPASVYTVNFEGTSLEGAIDAGWTMKARVFDPNADTSHFPERAPCFIISADSYGGTAGSVGFPNGRENVVFFGYIVEDSVAVQPEYNEITFDIESIAGVMSRADSPPVYLGDSDNPSGEPDAWAWGEDLNVFRGLVYLLKFHSTIMDIADVSLYNDTTLTKAVDYPADNLWNMLTQFAKGKRLLRTGVTRTGRVVVSRDPNLTPIASRGAYATVCQLAQGDWREQVTAPQKPYPSTSFICISGLNYDGDVSHEPNPLFGMSPGRPPKDYGSEREVQYLKLVDQVECNTLAGLLCGTDNLPYGDIVLPLRGNWTRCFEPALQEYVQTPGGGWLTKRGTLLDGIRIIVRKVSVAFDWNAGTMMPTLTCEYPSQPEIGVNGDCFPADAPPPPGQIPGGNIVIPPAPPKPTGTSVTPVHIWTFYSGNDIYELTSLSPAGGIALSRPNWVSAFGALYYATGHVVALANKQAILAESAGFSGTSLYTAYSGNEALGWTVTDPVLQGYSSNIDADRTNRARVWGVSLQPRNPFFDATAKAALAAQPSGVGNFSYATALANWTDWYADWGPIYVFASVNSGQTFSVFLLDYIGQMLPTRMVLTGTPSPTNYGYVGGNANQTVAPTTADWTTKFCSVVVADAPPGGIYGGVYYTVGTQTPDLGWIAQYADGGGAFQSLIYKVCNSAPMRDVSNLSFFPPTPLVVLVAPAHDNATAYVLVAASYYTNVYTVQVDANQDASFQAPASPLQYAPNNANTLNGNFYSNTLFRINSTGASSRISINNAGETLSFLASDPTSANRVYLADGDGEFITEIWGTGNTTQTLPVGASAIVYGVFVTSQGTVLVGYSAGDGTRHILRSTNHGSTWSDTDVSASVSLWDLTFLPAEYNGHIGGAGGVVVVNVETTGKYLYSINDGVAWSLSGDITVHDDVNGNSAR